MLSKLGFYEKYRMFILEQIRHAQYVEHKATNEGNYKAADNAKARIATFEEMLEDSRSVPPRNVPDVILTVPRKTIRDVILTFVSTNGGECRAQALYKEGGYPKKTMEMHIGKLVREGLLSRCGDTIIDPNKEPV